MTAPEDIMDGLEERLLSHSKAFESLLALTPAQEYYGSQIVDGKDPSEQWRAKKQTKEEKRLAKKAKLDPANQKSALDVMKERERKRKRELGMDDDSEEAVEDAEQTNTSKRQKVEETAEDAEERRKQKAEARKEKREKKKAKAAKLKEKRELKKAAKLEAEGGEAITTKKGRTAPVAKVNGVNAEVADEEDDEDDADSSAQPVDATDMEKMDFDGLIDDEEAETGPGADDLLEEAMASPSTAPSSPDVDGIAFDTSANHSTTSSLSSIVPPTDTVKSVPAPQRKQAPAASAAPAKPTVDTTAASQPRETPSGVSSPRLVLPNIDSEALQERLRARIEELRAKRKADGPEGNAPKSRQDLLDQRRKKEEQRKAHKKELRRKAKEEESRKQEERLRGSGSPLSADIFLPRSPKPQETNFSFSRLAFDDGTAADPSLSGLVDAPRKKGPQDARGALLAAEGKAKRLASYDPTKQADIAEKDLWLNAKKRAHGERVRDDTSLLKKALKRKEKGKGKSEKEWDERKEAVVKGKEMKDKRREGNLQKRREGKGDKGKQGGNSKGGGAKKGKPKGRPGFEGRFKA
ncbi:hypothetical protein B0A48_03301 [Cryoendolithus antarcticus]|uniref:Ribosomal RNA-processing protein 14/surfeit locus protein 6 C-terminal domain-containing protein n=1 Tax=Cryoendolithus antarcticus TaxID=1507870 RepID=A0A1V8TJU1_9PEZI|nr:hypothetical protein B0A48_03301 [Cryoendolithus antarcticus]